MNKILVLLVWLLGLAAIGWLCGHEAAPAAAAAAASTIPPPGTPAPAVAVVQAPAALQATAPAAAPVPASSASIAAAGRKINDVLERKVVEFRSGSTTLTDVGRATLAEIAPVLKENPTLRFEVQGHTDALGTEDANQSLSQARAVAVKEVLASLGVAADRIGAKGFGSSMPVADNNTAEGRARNRRIAFSVEENP